MHSAFEGMNGPSLEVFQSTHGRRPGEGEGEEIPARGGGGGQTAQALRTAPALGASQPKNQARRMITES